MFDSTDGAVAVAEVETSATAARHCNYPVDPQPIDYVSIIRYIVHHPEVARHVRRVGGKADAFQIGWFGLVRACESYTPNSGKFFNYAAKAIQRAIIRQSLASGMVRVPESMQRTHRGKRPDQRKGFEDAMRAGRTALIEFGYRTGQFDVAAKPLVNAADLASNRKEAAKLCGELLEQLDKTQRDTIRRHFGIGCEPMSKAASGRVDGVTDTAIKFRIRRSLEKMRKCVDQNRLESLIC